MLSCRLKLRHLPLPIGQAKTCKRPVRPRLFTQNSQLLLVPSINARPQLPFLHPATGGKPSRSAVPSPFQQQLSRLITTETKVYLKTEIKKGLKWSAYVWLALSLVCVMFFGVNMEAQERKYPSPSEWSFFSRFIYHTARGQERPDEDTGQIDWTYIGTQFLNIILRLEHPSIDGKDLKPILQDDGDFDIAGAGRSGKDVTSKSEPWRRGYYTCLMGLAKAAENREGWVKDITKEVSFPGDTMIGPSNPKPSRLPYGAQLPAPLEENCILAFDPPQTYYMKILTTHGFTSRQRLEAALAYADWLDYKGLSSTAEEMCDWGLDIATGALPVGVNSAVDIKTGIIDSNAGYVSSNILLASTSLAYHYARNNNLAAALPIYLSVLRSRWQLSLPASTDSRSLQQEKSPLAEFVSMFKSLVISPPYPPAPSTGDEVPYRTPAEMCEEAAVMAHIGEILFASSSANTSAKVPSNPQISSPIQSTSTSGQLENQQAGLSWTRDAVDLAEATLVSAETDDEEAHKKCSECLSIGMDNWSTMVSRMLEDEKQKSFSKKQTTKSNWLWGNESSVKGEGRWERESKLVEQRQVRVESLLAREEDRKNRSGSLLFGL